MFQYVSLKKLLIPSIRRRTNPDINLRNNAPFQHTRTLLAHPQITKEKTLDCSCKDRTGHLKRHTTQALTPWPEESSTAPPSCNRYGTDTEEETKREKKGKRLCY
jgi:hypothetical protein